MSVVYSDGGRPKRPCPVHDRQPIPPANLWVYLWVLDQIKARHADHYMPEAGCVLCREHGPTTVIPPG